jgi:hypothetical protein
MLNNRTLLRATKCCGDEMSIRFRRDLGLASRRDTRVDFDDNFNKIGKYLKHMLEKLCSIQNILAKLAF